MCFIILLYFCARINKWFRLENVFISSKFKNIVCNKLNINSLKKDFFSEKKFVILELNKETNMRFSKIVCMLC